MNAYNWEQVTLNCSSNHMVCEFQGIPSAFRESRRLRCLPWVLWATPYPFLFLPLCGHQHNLTWAKWTHFHLLKMFPMFDKIMQYIVMTFSPLPASRYSLTIIHTLFQVFFLKISLFKKIKLQHPKWCSFCVD